MQDLYKNTSGKSSRSIVSVDSHASYVGLGKKTDSARLLTYPRGPHEKVVLFSHSPEWLTRHERIVARELLCSEQDPSGSSR